LASDLTQNFLFEKRIKIWQHEDLMTQILMMVAKPVFCHTINEDEGACFAEVASKAGNDAINTQ